MNREILHGDVLDKLAAISDETIDVIISSPPYWGLRDYSVEGQLGLEPDFHDYLNTMQKVMDGLKRVLKPTGTCWINLGDTYKNKSLVAIPERFYINCLDNGWLSRNHNAWTKNNSMPSSVKDRFTNKWESVFFFAKQQKYYFDLDAGRVPSKTASKPFNVRVRDAKNGVLYQKFGSQYSASDKEIENYDDDHITKKTREKLGKGERKWSKVDGQTPHSLSLSHNGVFDENGKLLNNPKGKNPGDIFSVEHPNQDWIDRQTQESLKNNGNKHHGNSLGNPKGKNPGDIFEINTKPFKSAHFATFPVDLPLRILKCACPNQVCNKCGKARESITDHTVEHFRENNRVDKNMVPHSHNERPPSNWKPKEKDKIIGYTDCGCNAGFKPGIVLDPFFGAGTVGVAAEKLGLNWIGIELNAEYIKIAQNRLSKYMNNRIEAFV